MPPSERTPSPAREAEQIAERLHSVALRLSRGLRTEGVPISAPLLSALATVASTGPVRIGDLAAAEGVEAPTMSRLVDRLQEAGLVTRRRDPGDARAIEVAATSRAARALAQARRGRTRPLSRYLSELSTVRRKDLTRALDLLEELARILDTL